MRYAKRGSDSLLFVLITVAGNAIGIGIILPILPQLLVELTGENISRASIYGGWLTALFSIAQFLAAPLLGNLSDRFGRRPILLCSLAAFGVNYIVTGLAPTLGWLFASRILAGACAGTISTANAYVADITTPGDRARQFGMVSAAFSVGFILGPVLGGVLGEYGTRVPFFAAAGLSFLNLAYGFLILPESLTEQNRRPFSVARCNPFLIFLQLRNQAFAVALFGALGLMQIASLTVPIMWAYITALKFNWSQSLIGLSLGLYGLGTAVTQGVLTGPINRLLGNPWTACMGCGFMIAGLTGFAFSADGYLTLAFIVPTALGSMTKPALLSIIASRAPADAQGELHGAVSSITSIAAVATPILMTQLFNRFSMPSSPVYFPGAPFALAALFSGIGLLLATRVRLQSS